MEKGEKRPDRARADKDERGRAQVLAVTERITIGPAMRVICLEHQYNNILLGIMVAWSEGRCFYCKRPSWPF